MGIRDVCCEVVNMLGQKPSYKAVWRAIQGVKAVHGSHAIQQTKYANCSRKKKLTLEQEKAVVDFLKAWRNKRFCTCDYIRSTMKLKVSKRTVSNTLNVNDLVQFEVLEISFEVQLRLHFHYDLFDVVPFEVLEMAFEV